MKKKWIIVLSLISIITLWGCEKDEVIIDKNNIEITANNEIQNFRIDKEGKPLIVISAADTVKILVREDGAPGMYLGKDGQVHGFYVDLEKMVMDQMGQAYVFVPYNDLGPALQAFKSGTHHIGLAAPDIESYRSLANLSVPYETLNYVTFVQKKNTDIAGDTKEEILKSLHGKRVGVQTRAHIFQFLRSIREIELIEYPTTTQALEALNNGLLDAVPDVKRIGIYYAKRNNWDIVPLGKPILSSRLTTGISKRIAPSFLDRYNQGLTALIQDGRFDSLYESYFGPMAEEDRP